MEQVINISELAIQVCQKLIEYGVQKHIAWSDYSANYRPIVYFFQDNECSQYNSELLQQYRQVVTTNYQEEVLTKRSYLSRLRATTRMQELAEFGELFHVGSHGNARTRLYPDNENVLRECINYYEPLSAKTRTDMEWAIRQYLAWMERQGVRCVLSLTAHMFSAFLAMCAGKYKSNSLHDIQLYMKKLHRFLCDEKGLELPYEFVLSLPIVREKRIFAPLTQDEIRRTVAQIDRNTVKGKRDYAIILLGARNGLRSSDIINLKLRDIDWRSDEIRIMQQKTGEFLATPLMGDVGEAIKEYILNGRPVSVTSEYIFIRTQHPYLPLKNSVAVCHLWNSYQQKAGIERVPHDGKGFHSLRRTLGSELTIAGIPVTITAQVLGHKDINSTKQYIATDSKHLKECSLDFAGIPMNSEVYLHG